MGRTSLDILSIEYEFEIISWRELCGGIVFGNFVFRREQYGNNGSKNIWIFYVNLKNI